MAGSGAIIPLLEEDSRSESEIGAGFVGRHDLELLTAGRREIAVRFAVPCSSIRYASNRERLRVLSFLRKNTEKPLNGVADTDLFERFREGDNGAFGELFRRHNPRLYLYCLKIVGDRQGAEDVTQEVWEKVIGLRAERGAEVRNPVGLLIRIARNLCIDHLRRSSRMVAMDEIDERATPMFASSEPGEIEEIAVAALDQLPYDYREVLILNIYCGYRYDEIAAMLDKTPDAIWARASRARTQLRRIVAASMEPIAGSSQSGAADKPMSQRKTER